MARRRRTRSSPRASGQPEQAAGDPVADVAVLGDEEVLEDGEAADEADVLEGAADAADRALVGPQVGHVLAADADVARGRRVEAGHAVEERGLAGAVGADEADDLVLVDGEADVLQGLQAAEADRDPRAR